MTIMNKKSSKMFTDSNNITEILLNNNFPGMAYDPSIDF